MRFFEHVLSNQIRPIIKKEKIGILTLLKQTCPENRIFSQIPAFDLPGYVQLFKCRRHMVKLEIPSHVWKIS